MWSIFSCAYWLFVYLPWKNIYLNPFSIFKLGCLLFVVDFKSSFYIPVTSPLSNIWLKYFLQFFFFFHCTTWHVGSQFPDQGLNPWPLQWKHGVVTTGALGKSLQFCGFLFPFLISFEAQTFLILVKSNFSVGFFCHLCFCCLRGLPRPRSQEVLISRSQQEFILFNFHT